MFNLLIHDNKTIMCPNVSLSQITEILWDKTTTKNLSYYSFLFSIIFCFDFFFKFSLVSVRIFLLYSYFIFVSFPTSQNNCSYFNIWFLFLLTNIFLLLVFSLVLVNYINPGADI